MKRVASRALRWVIFLFILNIPLAVTWEVVFPGRIYDCPDESGFGYLTPGNWVHDPIEYVDEVVTGRSMGEPDTMRLGWSKGGLLFLWGSLFTLSAAGSWWLAKGPAKRAAAIKRARAMGVG